MDTFTHSAEGYRKCGHLAEDQLLGCMAGRLKIAIGHGTGVIEDTKVLLDTYDLTTEHIACFDEIAYVGSAVAGQVDGLQTALDSAETYDVASLQAGSEISDDAAAELADLSRVAAFRAARGDKPLARGAIGRLTPTGSRGGE